MQIPPTPQTDNLTKFLATWGAILGTFGLGWTLYRDLLDRPKLKVSAHVRRIGVSNDGRYYAAAPHVNVPTFEKLFVVVSVVNVGRRPVTCLGIGGEYYQRKPGGRFFRVMGIQSALPKLLQEGEALDVLVELETDLMPASDMVKKLHVSDPSGRKWALSRNQLKELKEEAREAIASLKTG